MRPIWKGTISFGLVNIPIALYRATQPKELKFNLLRKKDLSPIHYKRVADDGKEVEWQDIVKGYEYEKGRYVVLADEDFEKANVEATQSVDITDFVPLKEINPMFFNLPYYMEPQKGADKAYVLLREALQNTDMVGIAKVVIKTRQHLAAIKPRDGLLVLELMHFADELADPAELKTPKELKPSTQEVRMAKALVEDMTTEWKPEKYKDDYSEALMKLIEKKIKTGGKEVPASTGKAKQPTNVIDLVEVLRQSLAAGKKQPRKKAA